MSQNPTIAFNKLVMENYRYINAGSRTVYIEWQWKILLYIFSLLCLVLLRAETGGLWLCITSVHHPGPARAPAVHRCCPNAGVLQTHGRGCRQKGRSEKHKATGCNTAWEILDISLKKKYIWNWISWICSQWGKFWGQRQQCNLQHNSFKHCEASSFLSRSKDVVKCLELCNCNLCLLSICITYFW